MCQVNAIIANIDVEIMDLAIIFVRIFFSLNQIHVIRLTIKFMAKYEKDDAMIDAIVAACTGRIFDSQQFQ